MSLNSFSDFLENTVLDHVFGRIIYTPPATVHIALLTIAPTEADTGATITEPVYTGYARLAVANNKTNFTTSSAGTVRNAVDFTFAVCTAGSGTVVGAAICSLGALGDVLAKGTLAVSKVISAGDTPRFAANDLIIILD